MTAQPVDDDGYLPAALRDLDNAIHNLTGEQMQYLEGKLRTAPSLLDQIVDELAGQQGSQHGSHARSMPPLWVDGVDLIEEINTALDAWGRGLPALPRPLHVVHTITARVRQLDRRPYRPQDVRCLEQITATLNAWAKKAYELLNPKPSWSLPNPCPACNTAVVYRPDSTGTPVRKPALSIGPTGCTCLNCHYTWAPEYFQHLANVLGYELPEGVLE